MSFADVVRRTISEVRGSEEPDTRVRDHGQTRVIKNEEVLVLKPRCPEGASAMPSSLSVDRLTNVLKSIPVKNLPCNKLWKCGGEVSTWGSQS